MNKRMNAINKGLIRFKGRLTNNNNNKENGGKK